MKEFKLGERIAFFRKQKGITQEELAKALGVTNQSVSKWESGSCCPDIQLLPEIADYFRISADDLLGRGGSSRTETLLRAIRPAFESAEREDCFDLAYKIAFSAAEGAQTGGYRDSVPWETSKIRTSDDDFYHWGYSVRSEPDGIAQIKGNSVFLTSNRIRTELTGADARCIQNVLRFFSGPNSLTVFFALYGLTVHDETACATAEQISEKCGLSVSAVEESLLTLPVEIGTEAGFYRIDGPYLHVAPLLGMLSIR